MIYFKKYDDMKENYICTKSVRPNTKFVLDLSLFEKMKEQYSDMINDDIIHQFYKHLLRPTSMLAILTDRDYVKAETNTHIYSVDLQFKKTYVYSKRTWKIDYYFFELVGVRGSRYKKGQTEEASQSEAFNAGYMVRTLLPTVEEAYIN